MSSVGVLPILIPSNEGRKETTGNETVITYINLRIVTYDTNKDGKREIIIVKNISTAARTFQHV